MHLEYRVRLPDHDWVVATKHKLIPFVYGRYQIHEEKVGYSGPTYIAIRSGKHAPSTAETHAFDLQEIIVHESEEIRKMVHSDSGVVKPVFIFMVDVWPGENSRHEKTVAAMADHFKNYYIDALLCGCYAPGTALIERRMAPLSHDLVGMQIFKCDNNLCCKPFRSTFKNLLDGRQFLPNPVPFVKTEEGVEISKNLKIGSFGSLCWRLGMKFKL